MWGDLWNGRSVPDTDLWHIFAWNRDHLKPAEPTWWLIYYPSVKVHSHYTVWQSATQYGFTVLQKLLGICCKISHAHIKKEFLANYFPVYKNCIMKKTYASYAAPKITSHYSKTFDDTDTLPIKFSCSAAFCNMLQLGETMPKPHRIDIYAIFGLSRVAKPCFYCILPCGIVWMHLITLDDPYVIYLP